MPSASGIGGWIGYPLFKLAVWWEGDITLEELTAEVTFPRWVAYSYHVDELPIGDIMSFMGAKDEVVEADFKEKKKPLKNPKGKKKKQLVILQKLM